MKHSTFDIKKAVQVLNYLTRQSPDMKADKVKIMKLVWAADRYHLLKYGRTVVDGEKYYAMKYGPVPSTVKDILEDKNNHKDIISLDQYTVRSLLEVDMSEFSDSDKEALDFALSIFGRLDTFVAAEKSHNYPEWHKHENKITTPKSRVPMDVQDFFLTSHVKEDPFSIISQEARDCAKDIFTESQVVKHLLHG